MLNQYCCQVRGGHHASLFKHQRCCKSELCDYSLQMIACGQMWLVNGSSAGIVVALLKGCKINQRRMCNGNLWGPQNLKYLLSGSLQIKFAGGIAQQCTGKQTESTWSSQVVLCHSFHHSLPLQHIDWEGFCLFNAVKVCETMNECLQVWFLPFFFPSISKCFLIHF